MAGSDPTLLGGTDVRRCVRRIHNEHDPTIPTAPWEPSPELQLRFDRGREFEAEVFANLMAVLGPQRARDLSGLGGKDAVIAATHEAMADSVEVILGGWLADDQVGGRKGRPDLLIRFGEEKGRTRYLPGDVKGHLITKKGPQGSITYSTVNEPALFREHDGLAPRSGQRPEDYLQVAHYWRMLQAVGRAPSSISATGCIIGTDRVEALAPAGQLLVWLNLEDRIFKTFSRTNGSELRTALERYDHEFAFRLQVAQNAALRTGGVGDPLPLVEPIFTDECTTCPWDEYCATQVAPDLASLRITEGRLSVREWRALTALGVRTLGELAAIDPTDPVFLDRYLPEVSHVASPAKRLAAAVTRAQMISSGVSLQRKTEGRIDLPRAEIEIDLDIEWGNDDRVYLWGALINRHAAAPVYQPFVSWEVLDDASEQALALSFATWLRATIAEAKDRGETVRVYHYASPEPDRLKRILGGSEVSDLLNLFTDLHKTMSTHFFGLQGLGLKAVVPVFGFAWDDDDAGGLQSQTWLLEALHAEDPAVCHRAQQRLLQYNADDVAATAALRKGVEEAAEVRQL